MPYNFIISAPYLQPVLDRFAGVFAGHDVELLVPPVAERMEEDELLQLVGDVDGVVCGDDRFTERVMRAAPRLKVISKWGTGTDSIDADAARRLGIRVCNTPDAFTDQVADTAVGLMLCFARLIPWLDRAVRDGTWRKLMGTALCEGALGIIGVGRIGKAVTRRARSFGMRVLGNDPVEMPPQFLCETGIEMVGLDELLAQSDFVSLHCDLNPTSRRIIGEAQLAAMRGPAVLINTARGGLVDEPALVAALQAGEIAGAGLDVYEVEPLPEDSPLRRMDNVLLAPHNANSSPAAWQRVHENTIGNLVRGLREVRR